MLHGITCIIFSVHNASDSLQDYTKVTYTLWPVGGIIFKGYFDMILQET